MKQRPLHRDFRVQDLAALLDTNPRRIEGWVEQGLLKPAHPGRGTGRRNVFSLENVGTAYILTELQRLHGDKSPILSRLLSSEPAAVYARTLGKWLDGVSPDSEQLSGTTSNHTLVLVHDGDGQVVGRIESHAKGERPMLHWLSRFLNESVGVTFVTPGQRFAEVRERLAGLE